MLIPTCIRKRMRVLQEDAISVTSIDALPLVPGCTLKYGFFVLTLQPYSTDSFNTIFFKLTYTVQEALCLSF